MNAKRKHNERIRTKDNLDKEEFDIVQACKDNDLEKIQGALLDNPACINARDLMTMETPIHITARRGYYRASVCLLESPKIDLSLQDATGLNAKQAAAQGGHVGIINQINWVLYPILKPEENAPD